MPIDKPEAVPTNRRTFLTRAAFAGALVTVGATAGPLTALLPSAGAQASDPGDLDDATFAAFAIPLEMAAVQAYQAALDGGRLDDDLAGAALDFQSHHQAVVDTLTGLLAADAGTMSPDPALVSGSVADAAAATAQPALLGVLADLEELLAATHLSALGSLDDATTAKVVAQVLAIETQQATFLGLRAGDSLDTLTPATASTFRARTPGSTSASAGSTTTTTGGGN